MEKEKGPMPPAFAWKLCTRTFSEDYFWIDQSLSRAPSDERYIAVADDSDFRCGYLYSDGQRLHAAIGRLDATRADRGGRPIRNVLCLSADRGDRSSIDRIRWLFAEAIANPSPMATHTAAASLARDFYSLWDQKMKPGTVPAHVKASGELFDPNTPKPASNSPLTWGCQYNRAQDETLARLSAMALKVAPDQPFLIAVAATKSMARINEALRCLPLPEKTIVCSLTASHGKPFPSVPPPPATPKKDPVSKGFAKLKSWMDDKRARSLLFLILAGIVLWWFVSSRGTSDPTSAAPSNPPQQSTPIASTPSLEPSSPETHPDGRDNHHEFNDDPASSPPQQTSPALPMDSGEAKLDPTPSTNLEGSAAHQETADNPNNPISP